jgi:hypothetical protein
MENSINHFNFKKLLIINLNIYEYFLNIYYNFKNIYLLIIEGNLFWKVFYKGGKN